jgi:homoserine kinase
MGRPLSRKELVQHAIAGESLASGSAHADNLAPVLLGGFTLVRSNKTLDIVKLPCPQELVATVLHPKIELKTMHSRAILKNTIPLSNAVEQWGNLGAFVSALYTNDYELLSRSMVDKIVEPYRALLIPKFNEVKNAAINAGALGSGISGSGPSIYALSRGLETAQKVGFAMKNELNNLDLDFEVHISKINEQGVKILD